MRGTQLFVLTVIRDGSMWPLAVITAGGVAVIKSYKSLTYRGDNSTELYKYQKNSRRKKWASNGFTKMVIQDLISAHFLKRVVRKNK